MNKTQKWGLARIAFYAFVFVMLMLVPTTFFEQQSLCIYYNLFGVKCIGCGTTRAVANLLHGNLTRALEFNSLAVYLYFPLFGTLFLNDTYCVIRGFFDKSYHKNSFIQWIFGARRGK